MDLSLFCVHHEDAAGAPTAPDLKLDTNAFHAVVLATGALPLDVWEAAATA